VIHYNGIGGALLDSTSTIRTTTLNPKVLGLVTYIAISISLYYLNPCFSWSRHVCSHLFNYNSAPLH